MSNTGTALEAKNANSLVQSFDMSSGNLPDLTKATEVPVDLSSDYWTPDKEGEFKLVFFQEIKDSTCLDQQTGEQIELPCAFMIEQKEDRSMQLVRNGSKRLVGAFEDAMEDGKIEKGTPLKITYLGKQKNSTNSNMSDRWSIRPLSA